MSLKTGKTCLHFPDCGGCAFINIPYLDQLDQKTNQLLKLANQYAKLEIKPDAIVPCKDPYHYRNRMDFAFGQDDTTGQLTLGLKKRKTYDQIIPIQTCYLAGQNVPKILEHSIRFFEDQSAWNPRTRQGLLRHLVIRESKTSKTFLVMVVSALPIPTLLMDYAHTLRQEIPAISSVYGGIQDGISDTSIPNEVIPIWGEPQLTETIGHLEFGLSPTAFFQTNSAQATVLYDTIRSVAELKPTDRLVDLYCGTGTIGLYLSDLVQSVEGIEANEAAIRDAKANADRNQISNATFRSGLTQNVIKSLEGPINCLIVDPPRAGLTSKTCRRLARLDVQQLIYVSCNPTTLMQDLEQLHPTFEAKTWIPVDMFPHTDHIESVVRLTRR